MRLFLTPFHHPIALLSVCAGAFAVWVYHEARDPVRPAQVQAAEFLPSEPGMRPRRFVSLARMKPNPQEMAQVLPRLRPGMTRNEVEELVGAPAPEDVYPAIIADGRVTYHAAYEADLEPQAAARTLGPVGRAGNEGRGRARPNRMFVSLEFDATKPGHPLLAVHYPDPLF